MRVTVNQYVARINEQGGCYLVHYAVIDGVQCYWEVPNFIGPRFTNLGYHRYSYHKLQIGI